MNERFNIYRVLPFLLVAATSLVVAGSLWEQAPMHLSPRISICAYIPEEPLSKALPLAWQTNDNIRAINADNPVWLLSPVKP